MEKTNNGIIGILNDLEPATLPETLTTSTLSIIKSLEHKKVMSKLYLYSSLVALSLVGILYASYKLWINLKESGIYEYISLVFSNNIVALSFWREIGFAIIEALPLLAIALFLTTVITFVVSTIKAAENFNIKLKTI